MNSSRMAFIQQETNEQMESVGENLHLLYGSEDGLDGVLEIMLRLYGSEVIQDCLQRLNTEEVGIPQKKE